MGALRNAALALAALGLIGYAVGLGVYAGASTRPRVASQPRDAEEARRAIEQLGLEEAYPFEHRFVDTPHGRMHYADVGAGDPVLCLHGNPTWSFLYREFLRGLSDRSRVVAPDLIGFGLSQKLPDPGAYSIEGHIEDVSTLVEVLDLREVTLVMQDWGGPIGLGVAMRHPDRVRALVVMNTVGFSRTPNVGLPLALRVLRAPVLGEQLVQGLGLFQRAVIPAAIARPERRTPEVLRAYREVQGSWDDRAGTLAFPRLIPRGPDDPVTRLLERSDAYLRSFRGPVLIVWGMRDRFFGPALLAEWRSRFPDAPVLELDRAGHYLQEDAADRIVPRIRAFLDAQR
ncbi:MAG: alpha/beta fold hydrolase [Deltaproteobacteria bacterium]|nr:alpha/beta fold hydrolase [Deltaproteobacteria bacterium]MBW2413634.1 alpha/beta fold hydrolase [Deltaproteobacteria bacterium]